MRLYSRYILLEENVCYEAPVVVVDPSNGLPNLQNLQAHQHQPYPQPSQMNHMPQAPQQQPAPITSSMNRSQRCGVCKGCVCKPCGLCTYCQDSPQFGGPGVKKQSCIERRCLRVLENRLQRDAPTFKARVGCNNCEDCRMADCQICLVCLDKRFFENRYMTGAMCAKKRCNNATSIELPSQSPQALQDYQQRQPQKRGYDQSSAAQQNMHFEAKRRVEMGYNGMPAPQPQNNVSSAVQQMQQNGRLLAMNPAVSYGMPTMQMRMSLPTQTTIAPSHVVHIPTALPPQLAEAALFMPHQFHHVPSSAPLDYYEVKPYYVDVDSKPELKDLGHLPLLNGGDPFIPPSYVPEMKSTVVLQPL